PRCSTRVRGSRTRRSGAPAPARGRSYDATTRTQGAPAVGSGVGLRADHRPGARGSPRGGERGTNTAPMPPRKTWWRTLASPRGLPRAPARRGPNRKPTHCRLPRRRPRAVPSPARRPRRATGRTAHGVRAVATAENLRPGVARARRRPPRARRRMSFAVARFLGLAGRRGAERGRDRVSGAGGGRVRGGAAPRRRHPAPRAPRAPVGARTRERDPREPRPPRRLEPRRPPLPPPARGLAAPRRPDAALRLLVRRRRGDAADDGPLGRPLVDRPGAPRRVLAAAHGVDALARLPSLGRRPGCGPRAEPPLARRARRPRRAVLPAPPRADDRGGARGVLLRRRRRARRRGGVGREPERDPRRRLRRRDARAARPLAPERPPRRGAPRTAPLRRRPPRRRRRGRGPRLPRRLRALPRRRRRPRAAALARPVPRPPGRMARALPAPRLRDGGLGLLRRPGARAASLRRDRPRARARAALLAVVAVARGAVLRRPGRGAGHDPRLRRGRAPRAGG